MNYLSRFDSVRIDKCTNILYVLRTESFKIKIRTTLAHKHKVANLKPKQYVLVTELFPLLIYLFRSPMQILISGSAFIYPRSHSPAGHLTSAPFLI